MNHTAPTARDRLFALIASIPGSGAVAWCDEARTLLDEIAAAPVLVSPPPTRADVAAPLTPEQVVQHVSRAIFALKTPSPDGSQHYQAGWDTGLEAAMDAARDAVLAVLPESGRAVEELDRYRTAWRSARERAKAFGEGILLHVAQRDFWQMAAEQNYKLSTATESGRAATLLEVAARLETSAAKWTELSSSDYDEEAHTARELRAEAAGLRRLAAEEPQPGGVAEQAEPETGPRCTCGDAGDCFVPSGHYADCPTAVSEPALRRVGIRLGPNALALLERGETVGLSGGDYADLAREAAHAIVHRNDKPDPNTPPRPT